MRVQSAIQPAVTTITKTITVAAGVFAPGHLGELTWQVPFELADAVLAETRTTQRRLRVLPSRAGIYFVLALGLFPGLGYQNVWGKLTAALDGLELASPSARALRDLRRRIGAAPVKALFEVLAGPVAQPSTPGVSFGRYRTVAFDGCTSIKAPDTARNRAWLGKMKAALGVTGYPAVELMTLAETGTRALIGAVFGPPATGETDYARRLLHLLTPGMLVLADRGFDAGVFLAEVAAPFMTVPGPGHHATRDPRGLVLGVAIPGGTVAARWPRGWRRAGSYAPLFPPPGRRATLPALLASGAGPATRPARGCYCR